MIRAKKKNIFAVCDTEIEYAYNFMEYLMQKKNIPFEDPGVHKSGGSDGFRQEQ